MDSTDLPEEAINPYVPAGTPPAKAAHLKGFWCAHAVEWEWKRGKGGYLPLVEATDEMHPADIPIRGQGALPAACQPATGFDPREYPRAGPAAVARARREVGQEMRERRNRP